MVGNSAYSYQQFCSLSAIYFFNIPFVRQPKQFSNMSSAASRMAVRSAGRGTKIHSKVPNRLGTPVIRLQSMPTPQSGAGRGEVIQKRRGLDSSRSEFSASVLTRSDSSWNNNNHSQKGKRSKHKFKRDNDGSRPQYEFERQQKNVQTRRNTKTDDWFTSAARAEALESLNSISMPRLESPIQEEQIPFGWIDLTSVCKDLPEGHWATGYMEGIARNLENNRSLQAADKEKVLTEILDSLKDLSSLSVEDERFQDA